MATITIQPETRLRKFTVEINLDQWERLADALGMYRKEFLNTLARSLRESKQGQVKKIKSLQELV